MPTLITVPLDGSEKDARALAVADAVAGLSDADLELVRVVKPPSQRLAAQSELLGLDAAAVTGRHDVEQQLTEAAAGVASATGRKVTWVVLESDDVAAVLMRHAAKRDARVVVMATRAASAIGRSLRGSVADHVMRECPRPVALVPPRTDDMRGRHVRLERLLVPLDGSALAEAALELLLELPRAASLEYVIVGVVPPGGGRQMSEKRLQGAADRVRALGIKRVEVAIAESGLPAEAIVAGVREVLADAIVMSTRGAGGVRRAVLGSVAEDVIRRSEVPVLLLTPASLTDRGYSDAYTE